MEIEVAIIGASSSGLFAAKLLAKAGKSVVVFERQAKINPARRTYIITQSIRGVLDKPGKEVLNEITTMALETQNARAEIRLAEPDLIIERSLLIKQLAVEAQKAGADIYLGHSFVGLAEHEGNIVIEIENGEGKKIHVKASALIGADGSFSKVGKAAGIPNPPTTSLVQAEIVLPKTWNPKMTKVWFDVPTTEYFYWLIPESNERGIVGLIANKDSNARNLLDEFLKRHDFEGLVYQAGKTSMYRPNRKPYAKLKNLEVLLIGDAAGHVKVTTVGGSVSGFRGAAAAVESVISGIAYKQTNRSNERELKLHWLIRRLLDQMSNKDYDQLVLSLSPGLSNYLGRRNRDQMAGKIWGMILLQPRLIFVGAKLMLKLIVNRA